MVAAVFWPTVLGLCVLAAGLWTYRRDGLVGLGPVFVAASLAAFAGEHFTAAASLAQLVPKWLPGRLFIAYFVGVAHLAAALSFVAKRYVRWSAALLAIMFALFVLLMDLPGAVAHPSVRIAWSLAAREATFSIGAAALFATVIADQRPRLAREIAAVARFWLAGVLIFYGVEHMLYPQFWPGVPDVTVTAAWVPLPRAIAYATGILLIAFGVLMSREKFAAKGAALCGALMTLLTLVLYTPAFFVAQTVADRVTALNFVFDTLLFAGTALLISNAIHGRLAASRTFPSAMSARTDSEIASKLE